MAADVTLAVDARAKTNGHRVQPVRAAILAIDVAGLETPPIRSYSTGIRELDALIGGGISTRQLLSVLGPPGAGKSAWAVATAIRISKELPVLYASTELEQHEVMARVAANILGRPWSAIVRGDVPRSWVLEALDGVQIYILGSERVPRDGEAAIALIRREAGAIRTATQLSPLVVVDYLQDLARGSDRDPRARTGDIASELRAMAQDLDAPIIGVSSVARAYYSPRRADEMRKVDDPTVYLAAAKESGDVDYASAVVLFLDVDEDRSAAERNARIAVAKSRHGETGFAGARFVGASGQWLEAPDAIERLSSSGRAERTKQTKIDDADTAVLATVTRMHAEGEGELCTRSQLKGRCGIGGERVAPALERLVHAGRMHTQTIERRENGKRMRREIYAPGRPARDPQLDLDHAGGTLHGGGS